MDVPGTRRVRGSELLEPGLLVEAAAKPRALTLMYRRTDG
jgi:hypothetical protein